MPSPPSPPTSLVLLPGLHGTAGLFDEFRRHAPPRFEVTAIAYPATVASYDEAQAFVAEALAGFDAPIVVAESFSSPVAVRYAAAHPDRLTQLVLVAGFVRPPVPRWVGPRWARWLPWRPGMGLGRTVAPPFAKRLFGSRSLARQIRQELAHTSSSVLAARLRAVLTVDATAELGRVSVPILYLRGDRDHLVGKRALRHVEAHARDLTVRNLPATHFVLQNQPERAWQCIAEFCT